MRATGLPRWRLAVLGLVLGAALMAPGCKSGDGGSQTSGGKTRFAAVYFQEDQYFRLVRLGMQQEADKNNVELLATCTNSNLNKEIEAVNTYTAQKVDAIIISPNSKTASLQALKQAKEKGITIIADNTPIEGDIQSSYIECNATDLGAQTGKAARKFIQQKMGGKANIATVAFKPQVPEQSEQRTNGFRSQVQDLPGVRIVAEQDAWLPEMAVKKVADILTAHPEVNLIWCANEGGTIGAVMAVKQAGKQGKVFVFGTDASEQIIDFLLAPDNILQATTSQKPVDVGRMAVQAALRVKKGQPIEKVVSMPGILLWRDDPNGAKDYKRQLQAWIKAGGQ